jgi:hypothetical protein
MSAKINGEYTTKSSSNNIEEAIAYARKYLDSEENTEGFMEITSIEKLGIESGESETCGGCTLGDGRDCYTPSHYIDKFLVVCKKKLQLSNGDKIHLIRRSHILMGWQSGGDDCSNAYGDYNKIVHFEYVNNDGTVYNSYEKVVSSICNNNETVGKSHMFYGISRVEDWNVTPESGGNSMLYITHEGGTSEVYTATLTNEEYEKLKADCAEDGGVWLEMDKDSDDSKTSS